MNQDSAQTEKRLWDIGITLFRAVLYTMSAAFMTYWATRTDSAFVSIITNNIITDKVFTLFAAVCIFISAVVQWVKFFQQCRLLRKNNEDSSAN